jgi:hypothetical protein
VWDLRALPGGQSSGTLRNREARSWSPRVVAVNLAGLAKDGTTPVSSTPRDCGDWRGRRSMVVLASAADEGGPRRCGTTAVTTTGRRDPSPTGTVPVPHGGPDRWRETSCPGTRRRGVRRAAMVRSPDARQDRPVLPPDSSRSITTAATPCRGPTRGAIADHRAKGGPGFSRRHSGWSSPARTCRRLPVPSRSRSSIRSGRSGMSCENRTNKHQVVRTCVGRSITREVFHGDRKRSSKGRAAGAAG